MAQTRLIGLPDPPGFDPTILAAVEQAWLPYARSERLVHRWVTVHTAGGFTDVQRQLDGGRGSQRGEVDGSTNLRRSYKEPSILVLTVEDMCEAVYKHWLARPAGQCKDAFYRMLHRTYDGTRKEDTTWILRQIRQKTKEKRNGLLHLGLRGMTAHNAAPVAPDPPVVQPQTLAVPQVFARRVTSTPNRSTSSFRQDFFASAPNRTAPSVRQHAVSTTPHRATTVRAASANTLTTPNRSHAAPTRSMAALSSDRYAVQAPPARTLTSSSTVLAPTRALTLTPTRSAARRQVIDLITPEAPTQRRSAARDAAIIRTNSTPAQAQRAVSGPTSRLARYHYGDGESRPMSRKVSHSDSDNSAMSDALPTKQTPAPAHRVVSGLTAQRLSLDAKVEEGPVRQPARNSFGILTSIDTSTQDVDMTDAPPKPLSPKGSWHKTPPFKKPVGKFADSDDEDEPITDDAPPKKQTPALLQQALSGQTAQRLSRGLKVENGGPVKLPGRHASSPYNPANASAAALVMGEASHKPLSPKSIWSMTPPRKKSDSRGNAWSTTHPQAFEPSVPPRASKVTSASSASSTSFQIPGRASSALRPPPSQHKTQAQHQKKPAPNPLRREISHGLFHPRRKGSQAAGASAADSTRHLVANTRVSPEMYSAEWQERQIGTRGPGCSFNSNSNSNNNNNTTTTSSSSSAVAENANSFNTDTSTARSKTGTPAAAAAAGARHRPSSSSGPKVASTPAGPVVGFQGTHRETAATAAARPLTETRRTGMGMGMGQRHRVPGESDRSRSSGAGARTDPSQDDDDDDDDTINSLGGMSMTDMNSDAHDRTSTAAGSSPAPGSRGFGTGPSFLTGANSAPVHASRGPAKAAAAAASWRESQEEHPRARPRSSSFENARNGGMRADEQARRQLERQSAGTYRSRDRAARQPREGEDYDPRSYPAPGSKYDYRYKD